MIGKINIKRAIKKSAGLVAVLTTRTIDRSAHLTACILVYHRIAELGFVDPSVDDWNVPPTTFELQIKALAEFGEFVPLHELSDRLALSSPSLKPLVCLTFDDAYVNFYTLALPILIRYHVPATVFIITGYVGGSEPMPFDQWSQKNRLRVSPEAWQPMDWEQLETCLNSGLITLGAHSHKHLNGLNCTQAQLTEETEQSRTILLRRFGETQARAYAYPYGSARLGHVSSEYVSAVKTSGYELAVTTDLGVVRPDSDLYLLPRVEAHALDTASVLRAKVLGALTPYYLIDKLRKGERSL